VRSDQRRGPARHRPAATARPPRPTRIPRKRERERGNSAVELVLGFPVLLLIVFTIVQFALVWHAEQVAQAAASQALAAARIQGGTQASGQAEADRILTQLASGALPQRSITVQRGPAQTTVTVSGTAASILPFWTLHIHAEAAGPVERTVP
jgi:Flp pilus assembly protein TadG